MHRKERTIIFVCSVIKDNILISKMIESSTMEDACILFEKEYAIRPETILGPFFKKKTSILKKHFDVKFKFGQNKQGIYDGWYVTAMPLVTPEDSMYLLYNKRIDGKKTQKPTTTIVKITEIKDLV